MPADTAAAAAAVLRRWGRQWGHGAIPGRGLGIHLHGSGHLPHHGGRAERAQETEQYLSEQVPPENQQEALRLPRPGEGQLAVAVTPLDTRPLLLPCPPSLIGLMSWGFCSLHRDSWDVLSHDICH